MRVGLVWNSFLFFKTKKHKKKHDLITKNSFYLFFYYHLKKL